MKGIRLITVIGCLLASHSALAATATGTVGVTLTLSNACVINGSAGTSGIPLGTLDFGAQPTTFGVLTTQLTNGGNPTFTVQCPPNDTPSAVLTNSVNTAPSGIVVGTAGTPPRYANSSVTNQGVYYSVYATTPTPGAALANGATIPPASSPTAGTEVYTLFGQIIGNGTNAGITAGTYTDTINITITY
ncbi:spore coat protein U domain-containing protein [Arsenophonus sp. aPb]|uniref:spore coat protein U domain-containing protein n=1 Tax=Arsenophonus sp. aPb TaxID=3041619 RepID=UPI0024693863|nr:spore coat protein U domain-containing protein [Arsenophonus sp. aPb]WGL98313.1 spore coat protein U domain-containing protein [Arsenophonus sp. aPb]